MPDLSRIQELRAAVEADPTRRSLRLALASALLDSGDPSGSLEQVRVILQARPADHEALGLGAMAAALCGDALAADTFAGALRTAQGRPASVDDNLADRAFEIALTIPLLSLVDVDGCFEEKRRLEHLLLSPYRLRRQQSVHVPNGIVLFGPEHSGKAHLARSLAGELHLHLIELDLAQIADPWGAPAAGAIREAFALANEQAPALVFLNNLERVTHRRLRYVPNGREPLAELEKAMADRDPQSVVVVGASASPWLLSPALRSPSMFDQFVLVGPPDREARVGALQRNLRGRSLPIEADLRSLAVDAEGCTTRDLAAICASAAEAAFTESIGRTDPTPLSDRHFRRALARQPKSGTNWFDTAYNFPEFMDDSSQFDPVFDYIRRYMRRVAP